MASTVTPLPTGAGPARTHSRRSVLRGLGIGGATAVVAGTALLSYRVFDFRGARPRKRDGQRRHGGAGGTPRPARRVAAAVLAAKPHNTQPWTSAWVTDAIDVFADPRAQPARSTRTAVNSTSGWVARWRTWCWAAAAEGLRPGGDTAARRARTASGWRTLRCPPLGRPRALCTRRSASGTPTGDPTRPVAVSAEILAGLGATNLTEPGLAVQWITDPGRTGALGGLLVDAADGAHRRRAAVPDGFAWFRSSNDDIQRYRDGLVLDGQGLSPLALGVAKLLPAVVADRGRPVLAGRRPGTARAAHTATTPGRPRRTQLDAGRLLQRIHLGRDQPGRRAATHEPDHRAHRPGGDHRGGAHLRAPVRRPAARGAVRC